MTVVQNFRDRRRVHEIRPDGTIALAMTMAGQSGMRAVGLGDVVSTASGRGRLGVGIYVFGSELRLAVGQNILDVLDVDVKVTRTTKFPLIRQFEISKGSERIVGFRYWWMDLFEDPFHGTKDILKFICELGGSRERAMRFYFVWQATKNGDDVTSATTRAAIDEAVAKSLQ